MAKSEAQKWFMRYQAAYLEARRQTELVHYAWSHLKAQQEVKAAEATARAEQVYNELMEITAGLPDNERDVLRGRYVQLRECGRFRQWSEIGKQLYLSTGYCKELHRKGLKTLSPILSPKA